MSNARDEHTTHDTIAGSRAYSLASEAIAAGRSLEAVTKLQIDNMQKEMKEIKDLVTDKAKEVNNKVDNLSAKIEDRFKTLDNRFWSLAMATITLLVTALIALIVKLLFPHVGAA